MNKFTVPKETMMKEVRKDRGTMLHHIENTEKKQKLPKKKKKKIKWKF